MFRTGWSQGLFCGETLEDSLEGLARLGYDGVELPVSSMLPAEITARLRHHGLDCLSVNASYIGRDRDLSAADPDLRAAAVAHVRHALRFAAHLGAPVAIIVPTRIGKLRPDLNVAQDWDHAVASLREIGALASDLGVTAVIECVNRAESHLANRLETACLLVEAAGTGGLGVMADSFHMNIEESDIGAALTRAAPHLRHVHLADNTRAAPGMGHQDLAGFIGHLRRVGYRGALVMECDVQVPDAFGRMAPSTDPAAFDRYAATARATLRRIARGAASPSTLSHATVC